MAIQREIDRSRRTLEPLAVAFVDVVGLKRTNDSSGHAAGDELLQRVVRGLTEALRPYDVILRYGGDEFVCALPGQTADGVRDRLAMIAAELVTEPARSGISVGVVEVDEDESLDAAIARADQAMLAGRRAG
jgi:diguanylate cyclase (GGDEF)-like protein